MIHHALHKGVKVAKVEAMQMWWWRSGAHGWRQSWRRARAGVHVQYLCCWPVVTPLSRQPESSTAHAIGVSHVFIKMCQFITWYFSWIHGWFCFITPRKSLLCSSSKRYTWTSWTEWWKDGNVFVLQEKSPTVTRSPSYLLPLWRGTCNTTFAEHGMHCFPHFQQKWKAEFHLYQMCHLNITKNYSCCYKNCLSFFYN